MTARLKGISANGGPLAQLPASAARESWQGLSITGLAATVAGKGCDLALASIKPTLESSDLEKVNDKEEHSSSMCKRDN